MTFLYRHNQAFGITAKPTYFKMVSGEKFAVPSKLLTLNKLSSSLSNCTLTYPLIVLHIS